MSRMRSVDGGRRGRRQFSGEFREDTVRLVLDEGKSGLTKEEREELTRLRKEVCKIRMECDILKKPRPSSPSMSSSLRDD